MSKTLHIQQRMSQRGIHEEMVKMALNFGKYHGDKIILNRKGIDAFLRELEQMKKKALKIRERGGLVVIEVNNHLITTYSLNSYKRKFH